MHIYNNTTATNLYPSGKTKKIHAIDVIHPSSITNVIRVAYMIMFYVVINTDSKKNSHKCRWQIMFYVVINTYYGSVYKISVGNSLLAKGQSWL